MEALRSNIIIATKVKKPNQEGFIALKKGLREIEDKLTQLTAKAWVIRLKVDRSAIDKLDTSAYRNNINPITGGAGGGKGGAGGPSPVRPGGNRPSSTTSQKVVETEDKVLRTLEQQQVAHNGILETVKRTDEEGKGWVKTVTQSNDLAAKNLVSAEKQRFLTVEHRKNLHATLRDLLGQGYAVANITRHYNEFQKSTGRTLELVKATGTNLNDLVATSIRFNERKGTFSRSREYRGKEAFRFAGRSELIAGIRAEAEQEQKIDKKKADNRRKANAIERQEAVKEQKQQEQDAKAKAERVKKDHEDILKRLDEWNKRQADTTIKAQQKQDKIIADAHVKDVLGKADQEKKDQEKAKKDKEKAQKDEADATIKAQERVDRVLANAYKKEAIQQAERVANKKRVTEGIKAAKERGFVPYGSTTTVDAAGNVAKQATLVKATGNAFTGYTLEILRANEATGKLSTQILSGSQAFKFLGDNAARAMSKVATWSLATATVFLAARAVGALANSMMELEHNTILLVRVGRNLISSNAQGVEGFELRKAAAEKLTESIIDLTLVYGGNAVEAQRAASVFLRAGQTQEQALESVRVSLLAAKIAEVDVATGAKLIQSAMSQFKLTASDMAPVLDSLNSLSNHYNVTTLDLLESISRSGSVFREHGGRLTELAAITAVTGQTTANTGSQIGNAMKTIQSNLDRLDIREDLFSRMGISTVNLDGSAKDLGSTLLELKGRMDSLTASEQKQLGINIAGVRQRNIFLATLGKAEDLIIAENKALLDAGSAQDEFRATANTLSHALEQLVNQLFKLGKNAGEPIYAMTRGMIDMARGVIALVNAAGKLPVQMATWITLFATIKGLLSFLKIEFFSIAKILGQMRLIEITAQIEGVSRATVIWKQTVSGLKTAMASLFTVQNAFIAAIMLVTYTMGRAAAINSSYASSLDALTDSNERAVQNERKRREAIEQTTQAIIELKMQERLLRSEGKNKEADERMESARRIAEESKLSIGGPGEFSTGKFAESVAAAELESEKRAADANAKLAKLQKDRVDKARNDALEARMYLENPSFSKDMSEFSLKWTSGLNPFSDKAQKTAEDRVELVAKAAYEEARAKLAEEQKKLKELVAARDAQEGNTKSLEERVALAQKEQDIIGRILKARERVVKFSEEEDVRTATASFQDQTVKERERIAKELGSIEREYSKAIADRIDLRKEENEEIKEQMALANKLKEDAANRRAEALSMRIREQEEASGIGLGRRNELISDVTRGRLLRQRRMKNRPEMTDAFAVMDLEQSNLTARIKANEARAKKLNEYTAYTPEQAAQFKGESDALKKDTAEALVKLADLQVDKAKSLLEIENDIAIARKQSADEAARALGLMSQEDKLRALAQANYFQKNPKARIGLDQQFNASADDIRITEQLFANRLKPFTEDSGPLAKMMRAAGIGGTVELDRATAEAKRRRDGRTDKEILERDGLQAANNISQQREGLLGRTGTIGANANQMGGAIDANGRVTTALQVDVKAFDYGPLVETFEKAVRVVAEENMEVMRLEVKSILDGRFKQRTPHLGKTTDYKG